MPNATDDTVSAIMDKWAVAFGRLDAGALASLYSKYAFFFGSNPNLYRGKDGVTAYFNGLPRWSSPTVQFTDVRTAPAGEGVINMVPMTRAPRPVPVGPSKAEQREQAAKAFEEWLQRKRLGE